MLSAAIEHYHRLLAEPGLASETAALLAEQIQRHRLFYGLRPATTILRPRFLLESQYQHLRFRTKLIADAIRRIHTRAMQDVRFRQIMGLADWEEELIAFDSGLSNPWPIARFDGFFVNEGRLRFVELNTQSPAGMAYADRLSDIYHGLPVMRRFAATYPVSPLPGLAAVRATIVGAYRAWSRQSSVPPRVAIVDWAEVATHGEFEIIRNDFERAGLYACVAAPGELEYNGKELRAKGEPINVVYRRVLTPELIARHGPNHDLFRAARDRAVCVVNPFPCRVTGKKSTFAILTDERYRELFTPFQRAAAAEHVPWTRILEERQTLYRGETIELIQYILAHRERFVLKPNDNYGGNKIVLGWKQTASDWQQAIEAGLADHSVVQERIDLPTEDFPIEDNGELRLVTRWLDTCPFVGGDERVFSSITRLSAEPVVNVAAGGALLPTFLLQAR